MVPLQLQHFPKDWTDDVEEDVPIVAKGETEQTHRGTARSVECVAVECDYATMVTHSRTVFICGTKTEKNQPGTIDGEQGQNKTVQ